MLKRELEEMGLRADVAKDILEMDERGEIALPSFLALGFLSHIVKGRIFGGRYVTAGDFSNMFGMITEIGALIASRSDCELDELRSLSLVKSSYGYSKHWDAVQAELEKRVNTYRDAMGSDPSSMVGFSQTVARVRLGFRPIGDDKRLDKVFNQKLAVNEQSFVEGMLNNAALAFDLGVAYALEYPDSYAKMSEGTDAWLQREDLPPQFKHLPSTAERYENHLEICRTWARVCRPEAEYLFA